MEAALEGADIVLAAGPAGVQVLRREVWSAHPTIELLADYNAAEPLGIDGVEATDELVEREGRLVLGALGVGGEKMKTHKACVRRLFERNDLVLNADGVYAVAKEIV
jgi:methylenetetrahydrofolate/methylenetetrahydromethanopterin dehydrogenase (NADP+)